MKTAVMTMGCLIGFSVFAGAGVSVPSEERPLFRAGLLSDTHISNAAGSWGLVQKAMQLFKREGVNVVCHLGDLAGDYAEAGYAGYRQAIEAAYGPKLPLTLYAYGGHDARKFVPKKGEEPGHAGAWANMRRILGIPHGMSDIVEHEGHSFVVVQEYFKDEAEVETLVAEAIRRHPGRPVFLLEHEPAFDTCENSLTWGNARIRAVCDRHPEVIHLSGHSHGSNRDELQIWQGAFTEVNLGCLQYWGARNENAAGMEQTKNDDGVMTMEVFSDRIVFRRFSLTTDREHRPERPWCVPWPHNPARAPYRPEARKAASRAPVWPRGAAASVAWLPTGEARLTVPVASHRDEPYRYTAEVLAADGTRRTRVTLLGEFWKPDAAKRGKDVVFTLSPAYFVSGEKVRLRVTAFDFYGNASRPLEALAAVPADRPACPVVWRCKDPKRDIRYFNCGWSAKRDERQPGADGYLDIGTELFAVTFPEGMVPADDPAGTRYRLVFTMDDRHERYGSWLIVVRNAETFAPLKAQGCRTAEGAAGPMTYALELTKGAEGPLPVLLWLSYGRPKTRLAVTDARLERLESKKE